MDKDIKIIMATNKTKREAEEYLKRGAVVYECEDYLKHFDEYAGELEEEYKILFNAGKIKELSK